MDMDTAVDPLLRGALNGAIATVPQSLTILAGKSLGLLRTPPPEQITETAMEKVGLEPEPGETGTEAAVVALHFAYGAMGGAVFSAIRPWLPGNDVAAGIGFGLAVWAGSYYGIMPALHLYPPPERDSPGRIATMVAAHVVYGAALGLLERTGRKRQDAPPGAIDRALESRRAASTVPATLPAHSA